jgi:hypothetical protein
MLGATFMYQGQRAVGLEMIEKCLQGFIEHGYVWLGVNIVNGKTGERIYGSDYYQNMMLWAVPAAIEGKDLGSASGAGSLVDRVIKAGRQIS